MASAGWCLRTKFIIRNSAGLGQKRPSVKCVALAKAILLFVLHIISRGPNAVHSEQQKALLPHTKILPWSWSPAFRKNEKLLYSEVMDNFELCAQGQKRINFLIHLSVCQRPVSVRQCKLWNWQTHLPSDHKTWSWHMIWVSLKFKGLLLSYFWRFIKS